MARTWHSKVHNAVLIDALPAFLSPRATSYAVLWWWAQFIFQVTFWLFINTRTSRIYFNVRTVISCATDSSTWATNLTARWEREWSNKAHCPSFRIAMYPVLFCDAPFKNKYLTIHRINANVIWWKIWNEMSNAIVWSFNRSKQFLQSDRQPKFPVCLR